MADADKGDMASLLPDRELTVRPVGSITGQEQAPETLAIRPFFFGQLPKAIRLLRPVTDAVRAAGIASIEGTEFRLVSDWPLRLPQLMDEAGEAVVGFVAFAISKPREWFDTLPADDGIKITKAVFEVNADFFGQRVAPMLGMSFQPVEKVATGEPSSADSSAPATAGQTSSATP